MNDGRVRIDFEAWWVENNGGYQPRTGWKNLHDGNGYNDEYIDLQWEAWQASRAALVVELPTYRNTGDFKGWNEYREKAMQSVHAAGITVKEG